jgi:hypothetical protein
MGNPQDWCISRQLWWGHRCPAYFVQLEGEDAQDQDDSDGRWWIIARTKEEADAKAKEQYGGKKYTLKQDEDVLDTWFSSGLWPFSTLGWPEQVSVPIPKRCAHFAESVFCFFRLLTLRTSILPHFSRLDGISYLSGLLVWSCSESNSPGKYHSMKSSAMP